MPDHGLGHILIEILPERSPVRKDDLLVQLDTLVCTVFRRIDIRAACLAVLCTCKNEQSVLHDRRPDSKSVCLGKLGVILLPCLPLLERTGRGTDEILVVEIAVERPPDSICAGFRNGVYGTAGKAGLADIERGRHDLDLIDGIQRDRVCPGLASVGTGGRKPERVVGHRPVDLEAVVAVVRAGE